VDAPAGDDAPQVQALADGTPRRVELVTDAQVAHLGGHVHVGAVERVALGVVVVEVSAVGDARVRVSPIWVSAQADDERGHRPDDLSALLHDDLPVRKNAQVISELSAVPHHTLLLRARKTTLVQLDQAVDVADLREPERGLAAPRRELLRVHEA
jgi:hypothetical protein